MKKKHWRKRKQKQQATKHNVIKQQSTVQTKEVIPSVIADDTDVVATLPVLEVDGLEHQLFDPESGDTFTLCIDKSLTIRAGSFTTILGPSGCGKTTLLTLIGLLRKPSKPKEIKTFKIYTLNGLEAEHGKRSIAERLVQGRSLPPAPATVYDLADLWYRGYERQIEKLRRKFIGFALQSGELLNFLTVSENIAVPLRLNGFTESQCKKRVSELLDAFELGGDAKGKRLAHARINKLSGGEFQRVVLARAIAHSPQIVFVDEPTSALNRELARKALQQLKTLQSNNNNALDKTTAVVMITHDERLSEEFSDQIVRMVPETKRAAGRIAEITLKDISSNHFLSTN
jgi:ABC-type lipoprotein export system ATPase subunit